MKSGIRTVLVISLLLALGNRGYTASDKADLSLRGKVVDTAGKPIAGPTVLVYADSILLKGTAGDSDGNFSLSFQPGNIDSVRILITSVAHETQSMTVSTQAPDSVLFIELKTRPHDIKSVVVRPRERTGRSRVSISGQTLREQSGNSLVSSDPVAAVHQPQVMRSGSNHSSKIRITGTRPIYYLNGLRLGQDPHHYGMFSIVPGSILDRLEIYPQGTPVQYGSPSIVSMETPWPEGNRTTRSFDINVLDASAAVTVSRETCFITGGMRKSLLDMIAEWVDRDTDRMTIPPTNYRDIFVGAGLELTENIRLSINQLYSRDYLYYRMPPSKNNPAGVETNQNTRREHISGRLEINRDKVRLKIHGGYSSSFEKYFAVSGGDSPSGGLHVDLKSRRHSGRAGFDLLLAADQTDITLGQEMQFCGGEQVSLRHEYWNFLPPDYPADNPFIYQQELNDEYGHYSATRRERGGAGYLGIRRSLGEVTVEAGLRADYFDGLARQVATSFRGAASGTIGKRQSWRLGFGTYYNHPLSGVLEPYQVIVRASASNLTPVKTALVHAAYSYGPVTLGVYRKRISSVPVIWPFTASTDPNNPDESFDLQAVSEGKIDFVGGDIAFDLDNLLASNLDLNGYYAYTNAFKTTGTVRAAYELSARHTFFAQTRFRLSRSFAIGSSLTARSGYPYSPALSPAAEADENRYTPEYYENYLARENSQRFPANIMLNLRAVYSPGRAEIYGGITNLTNNKNAVISTSAGYVYDLGIMPVFGVRYLF